MLVPDFGPTMNVIAYSPFQDGGSAEAVGESDRAIASDAAHKPMKLLRRFRFIAFLPWVYLPPGECRRSNVSG
jgi:hypothetical protein